MSMGKLRFLVDALQFMVDGKAELEGDTLQGLCELLEDAALQLQTDRRHAQQKMDSLEQLVQELSSMKAQQIVAEFTASLRK